MVLRSLLQPTFVRAPTSKHLLMETLQLQQDSLPNGSSVVPFVTKAGQERAVHSHAAGAALLIFPWDGGAGVVTGTYRRRKCSWNKGSCHSISGACY